MSRVIKAPNIREARPMSVVDREKTLRYVEDEVQQIREQAEAEAQELIEHAQSEIEAVRAEAEAQAEEIIAEAQKQAESIRETAKQEGMRQGNAAGRQEVRQEVVGLMADLAHMFEEGRQTLELMIADQEREIRRLVAQIASKVVLAKIDEDDETVARIAGECIRLASARQNLTILIHPEDRAVIERHCPEYRTSFDDLERIDLEEDPRVPRGGVIVETPSGGVDGRIQKQLAIITRTLLPEEAEESAKEEVPILETEETDLGAVEKIEEPVEEEAPVLEEEETDLGVAQEAEEQLEEKQDLTESL